MWVVRREIYFGRRKKSKRNWVEWQKYDANMHITMMQSHAETLSVNTLNVERVKIFVDMVKGMGSGLRVLDVGGGEGVISQPLTEMGNYVAALELPTVANLGLKSKVSQVLAGDAETLAFADAAFDLVVASEVLEHLWAPQSFIEEAYRVLKPQGHLIIETPEGEAGLNYDSHMNFYTVERLKAMLSGKFEMLTVKRLAQTGSAQTPTIIVLFQKTV
jgi:2-polyprenyl-3-methyl-5-hydroxy-6-metoxy-1,4-benzoquinol methylase